MLRAALISIRMLGLLVSVSMWGRLWGPAGDHLLRGPQLGTDLSPTTIPAWAVWLINGFTATATMAVRQAHDNPRAAGVTVAAAGMWVVWHLARAGLAMSAPKDPRRMFDSGQRRMGFARAGHRCEFDGMLVFTRCRRQAEHADHWLPHCRGGATTLPNLVAACAWHNTSKGAHIPTSWQTHRIAGRRRRYFPPGAETRPGARYRPSRT